MHGCSVLGCGSWCHWSKVDELYLSNNNWLVVTPSRSLSSRRSYDTRNVSQQKHIVLVSFNSSLTASFIRDNLAEKACPLNIAQRRMPFLLLRTANRRRFSSHPSPWEKAILVSGPVYLWENVDVFVVGLGRAYDNPSEIAARPDGCRGFDHFSVGLYFTLVS